MKPEVSLHCSQVPANCPYPEPDASSPHISTLFPQDPFKYYFTTYASVFRVGSFLQVFL
jgi:hypothetical protein